MTNHPNRSSTPYHVTASPDGELLGKFTSSNAAHRVAQWWSERWAGWTEVYFAVRPEKGGGIIGQYDKGMPSEEFRGRGDEFYPGGMTASGHANHNAT